MKGKCTCGKEAHSKSNNVGEFIKETQFRVSFSADASMVVIILVFIMIVFNI